MLSFKLLKLKTESMLSQLKLVITYQYRGVSCRHIFGITGTHKKFRNFELLQDNANSNNSGSSESKHSSEQPHLPPRDYCHTTNQAHAYCKHGLVDSIQASVFCQVQKSESNCCFPARFHDCRIVVCMSSVYPHLLILRGQLY